MGFFGNIIHSGAADKIGYEYESKIYRAASNIKKFIEDPNEKYEYEGREEGWGFNLDLKDKEKKLLPLNWISINSALICFAMKIIIEESTHDNKSESYKEAVFSSVVKKVANKININSNGLSQHVVEKVMPNFQENLGLVAQSGPLGVINNKYEIEITAAAHTITEKLFSGNIILFKYKHEMENEKSGRDEEIYGSSSDYSTKKYERHYEETCKRITNIIEKVFK